MTSLHSAIQPPLARAPRLDLDDAAVGQRDVERAISPSRNCARRRAMNASMLRHRAGRDLSACDFEPNQLFIAQPEKRFARRHGAEQIIEVLVGIDQPLVRIEHRHRDAQAIERFDQLRQAPIVRRAIAAAARSAPVSS